MIKIAVRRVGSNVLSNFVIFINIVLPLFKRVFYVVLRNFFDSMQLSSLDKLMRFYSSFDDVYMVEKSAIEIKLNFFWQVVRLC